MGSVWKNYRSTLLLLAGVVAGGLAGVLAGPGASVVKPVGDIFLNLIFVLVVPLVFLSVAQAVCRLKQEGMIGRMLGTTIAVFVAMSIIAGTLALLTFGMLKPFAGVSDASSLYMDPEVSGTLADAVVRTFTVPDFQMLLSKSNLLPLILFAAILGLSVSLTGSSKIAGLLEEGTAVVMKMMEIVMLAAPVGLGCYFADMLGRLGPEILGSYLGIFVIYCALALFVFFVVHSLYVKFSGGDVRLFWKHMLTPSLTAIATCSSAACMPVNIKALKDMGVNTSVAESVIPIGINLHKDGSVMTSVAKIMFALVFFSRLELTAGSALMILGAAVLVSVVVGAVPIGGMTGEILICSLFGIDPVFAATLMVIGTITDIPATLLNSTANVVSAVVVDNILKGKN